NVHTVGFNRGVKPTSPLKLFSCGRDRSVVNKLVVGRIVLLFCLSFLLLDGAESAFLREEGPPETKYDLLGRVTRIDYPEHPISHGRMRACYEYGSAGYIEGM
ncbi:hypothetical protein LFX16_19170, partial [Leptospira bandrabouensis]|nr:hypothetical protein [Leptospira bandrabouensis]